MEPADKVLSYQETITTEEIREPLETHPTGQAQGLVISSKCLTGVDPGVDSFNPLTLALKSKTPTVSASSMMMQESVKISKEKLRLKNRECKGRWPSSRLHRKTMSTWFRHSIESSQMLLKRFKWKLVISFWLMSFKN